MSNTLVNYYASSQPINRLHQAGSINSVGPSNTTLGLIAISLPFLVCCIALTGRKYRTLALKRRISRLERSWQLHCPHTPPRADVD